MVRAAVLKGKDPSKIIADMEAIDKMGLLQLETCLHSHLPPLLKPLFPFRIQRVGASHIERESVEGQTTQVERNSRSSHEDVCKYTSDD